MGLDIWQVFAVLLGVSGALIAPTIWFYRHNTSRIETENKEIISKLEASNDNAFSMIRTDLKEFRVHFDQQLTEVQRSVESRNREIKEFVSKELDYFRSHINTIEVKVDQTREKSHEIEKDLLRLENVIGRDYIKKEYLDSIIRRSS